MPADPQASASAGNPGATPSSEPFEMTGTSGSMAPAAPEPGEIGGGAGDGGGVAAPAAPVRTWRDDAKDHGFDLSSFKDDKDAWGHFKSLSERAKAAEAAEKERDSYRQLAQVGAEYQRYQPQFQQWFNEQQAALRAQQAKADTDPYARPQFDPRYETLVEYDQNTGALVPNYKAGGTLEHVKAVQDQLNWRRGFLAEPEKYLERTFKNWAKEQANELIKAQLDELRKEFAASNFLLTNRHFLYKHENGLPTTELTEDGKFVQEQLNALHGMGYSEDQQQQLVMHMLQVRRALAGNSGQAPPAQQTPPPTQAETAAASKADFLKTAAGHGASPNASTQPQLRPSDPPQNVNASLSDRLNKAFAANGVDDRSFNNVM